MTVIELQKKIRFANEAYRNGDSIISDEEYDALLEKLEDEMGLIEFECFKKSLTESKGTVTNAYVLGSLSKHKYEETDKFYKWIDGQEIDKLFCSDKIDGCSFYAEYRLGKLTLLTSRGDGDEGTDWTAKAEHMHIPLVIPTQEPIDVRGEVTLIGDSYLTLGYKTKRNGTAGIMNSQTIEVDKLMKIYAIAYEILSEVESIKLTIRNQFSYLLDLGFEVPSYATFVPDNTVHERIKEYYLARKAVAHYDMDGVVLSDINYLPENVFLPKAKIAFKINSVGIPTTLIDIEANISKGGLLKVTGIINPINIDGTTVGRVTLNNWKYIEDNGLGIGAEVTVIRSGEVIPKIVTVTKPVAPVFPTECPCCKTKLVWKGVDLACTNRDCADRKVMILESFLVENGVEGCTETSLRNWGITGIRSLLHFKSDGSKAQSKLMSELNTKIFSKPAEELFSNMSFDGAGTTTINAMLNFYGNGDLIEATKAVYLTSTPVTAFPAKVGIKTVEKIAEDWKLNVYLLSFIMKDARFAPVAKAAAPVGVLTGKTFLITGTLTEGRKAIEKLITDNGGTIASSVSKNLSYLLVGADAGSKLDKANKLGVAVIDEDAFRSMI